MAKKNTLTDYIPLLDSIKTRIRRAQVRATFSANAEMLLLYWDVGRIVTEQQTVEGWGAGVIPRLAADIKNDMPEVKGFSSRNMDRMIRFYKDYPLLGGFVSYEFTKNSQDRLISPPPVAKLLKPPHDHSILPPSVAKLPDVPQDGAIVPAVLAQIGSADKIRAQVLQEFAFLLPWGHHALLIEKIKDISIRLWYMKEAVEQGWTRDTLVAMIKKDTYNRQGNLSVYEGLVCKAGRETGIGISTSVPFFIVDLRHIFFAVTVIGSTRMSIRLLWYNNS
jgi:hypothetical protein